MSRIDALSVGRRDERSIRLIYELSMGRRDVLTMKMICVLSQGCSLDLEVAGGVSDLRERVPSRQGVNACMKGRAVMAEARMLWRSGERYEF